MAGIVSYGAYIPYNRLSRALIAKAWEGGAASGEKAIAGYDEDSLTMAVAAARDCPVIDMDRRRFVDVAIPEGRVLHSLKVCPEVMEAD